MTIEQQQTRMILQLKKDYDAAINDRDLWKAEAERWRKNSLVMVPFDVRRNDQDNGCPPLVLENDEEFTRAVWNAAQKV
jgi:hypothetical protein